MRAGLWVVGVVLLVTGCAGVDSSTRGNTFQQRGALPGERWTASSGDSERAKEAEEADDSSRQPFHRRHLFRDVVFLGGDRGQEDVFDVLLRNAGLEDRDERPIPGNALSPTQAARLLRELMRKPVTLGQFPSRLAVGHLLRGVMARGEMSHAELVRQVERFAWVAVLRPDGCMAWVGSGRTQQRVAPVEWRDGAFRAHGFELGRFYSGRSGVYRLLDDDLRELDKRLIAEVYDDADYVGRVLDGAESAVVKLALSIGHFVTYPLDSIAALKNLPAGVAALIESSPAYFERFRYMTRGEQIEAVAELTTNLLVTTGASGAATRTATGTLAGAEVMVPRVALSARSLSR